MMAQLRSESVPAGRTILKVRVIAPVLLVFLLVFFSALRWLKVEGFWGDPPRWMFEAWRVSLGEVPYRDFTWQYPPFSLLLFGAALRLFGATFLVVQVLVDLISAAIVLQFWRAARIILPEGISLALAVTLACAGAGNTGNFALFSLRIYTPALLTGMLGFLMMLEPVLLRMSNGSLSRRQKILLSIGATVALLSKPEFAMGAVGLLMGMGIYDARRCLNKLISRRIFFREQLAVIGLAMAPGIALYVAMASRAGITNLMAGVGGYGMATLVCPWWPTGLAIFGAVVALCQGAAAVVILQWLWPARFAVLPRRVSIALRLIALIAIPATILYFPYCLKEFPVFAHGNTPERMASFFLLMGSVLLPVMWWSIVLWPIMALGFGFARKLSPITGMMLALSTAGLLMSTRSIFGGTLNQLTLVTVAAYPVWFILGPVLLERAFAGRGGRWSQAYRPLLVLISAYAILRFGAAVVPEMHSHYVSLDTAAGRIEISDSHAASSTAVYRYVLAHTTASDRLADIAYGGAVNLATRHSSPLYSTQFSALAPAQRYLDLDLDRIRANPPRLVIAGESTYSAAEYGLCAETGCMFPELVWRSTRLACDPGRIFPVIEFIRQNYEPVAQFGEIRVYAPKGLQGSIKPVHDRNRS